MKSKKPLTDKEMEEWENNRDLGAELLEPVCQMKAGKGRVVMSPVISARKKSGLSQTEFAKLLGVSVRTPLAQARKQELLIEIAGYRCQQLLLDIKQNQLTAFTKALRSRLMDRSSGFGKEYLKLLVSEIRIKGNQAERTGSYSALAYAIVETKKDALDRVPIFAPNWLPDQGLNLGPAD